MKSVFVVALALAAITAAVEAKGQTKKRELGGPLLGYTQYAADSFPLGGLLELGSLHGLELSSYRALQASLGSGLGQGLSLTGLHGLSLPLGNIGQLGSNLGLGGAGVQDLTSVLGGGGLYGSGLALPYGYGGGNSLGAGFSQQLPAKPPVSVPEAVSPAAAAAVVAVSQQPPLHRDILFGAVAPPLPAAPPRPPVPPTAYPPAAPNQPIPAPVLPPAPLQLSAPASLQASSPALEIIPKSALASAPPPTLDPASVSSSTAVQAPNPVPLSAPGSTPPSAPAAALLPKSAPTGSADLISSSGSISASAPIPASVPIPASIPFPASGPIPASAPIPVSGPISAPVPAPTNNQPDGGRLGSGSLGYTNLGNGLFALGSGSLGYTPTGFSNPLAAQVQGLPINQQFNGLHTAAVGSYSLQQAGYDGQGAGINSAYGGYSLNGGRQANLNAGVVGLSLGYGGGVNVLGYGSGQNLPNGY